MTHVRFPLLLVAITVSVLLQSAPVYGESFKERLQAHPPAERAAALANAMQEKLSLTPEQVSAIRKAAQKYAAQTDQAAEEYTRRELRKQLKAIGTARDADFEKILSAEQFQAYKEDKRAILKVMRSQLGGSPNASADASDA